jgi:hypothetical protein
VGSSEKVNKKRRRRLRKQVRAGYGCLTPIILATWDAEIRRTTV